MLNEKINAWQHEIADIIEQKKEYNRKCSEKIQKLREKIAREEKAMQVKNDELIGQTVRDIFGEVTPENIEIFKKKIMLINGMDDRAGEMEEEPHEGQESDNTVYPG